MNPILVDLKKLQAAEITKRHLGPLRAVVNQAEDLHSRLEPKAQDEDSVSDFEEECDSFEAAIAELADACDSLENAEDRDEREGAIDEISNALDTAVTSLESLSAIAVVGAGDWRRGQQRESAELEALETKNQCFEGLLAVMKLPDAERIAALRAWLAAEGKPESVRALRRKVMDEMLKAPTPKH